MSNDRNRVLDAGRTVTGHVAFAGSHRGFMFSALVNMAAVSV